MHTGEVTAKTYCEKWPNGCVVCSLEMCDGKKETAMKRMGGDMDLNKITGVIICGFPGVGKSTVASNRNDIVDAESSAFSHPFNPITHTQEKSDEFPTNYVDQLVILASAVGGYRYVLASCHKSVREELKRRGVSYVLIVPAKTCKDEYLKRYIRRGDSADFIANIASNWDKWLEEIEKDGQPVLHLDETETLEDILP